MTIHWSADLLVSLRLALRARFITTAFWVLVILAIATLMASQFSGRQPATVALDVGISTIRLILPFITILIVQELFSREFDRRYFLTSLTYPRSRYKMFLGRFASSFLLVTILLVAMALLLALLIWKIAGNYEQATPVALNHYYIATMGFILLDLFTILSIASLLAITASTPSFVVIGTLGFTIVARSYSTIFLLLAHQQGLVTNPSIYKESIGLLTYLVPDLGVLDVRSMALYGTSYFLPSNWSEHILRILSYSFGLLGLSILALQRKQFN